MSGATLVEHLVNFCNALRDGGIGVSLSDDLDGATALCLVDIGDRAEVRRALGIALKIRQHDRAVFNALFAEWWVAARQRSRDRPGGTLPGEGRTGRAIAPMAGLMLRKYEEGDGGGGDDGSGHDEIGSSPEVLLRRKPFEQWSETDLRMMDRLMERLAVQLATRRSRRYIPTRGRGRVDLRRSLRHSLSTDGNLIMLARRHRAIERPRLVLLCDTSGSMDPHTRFLLSFVLSLGKVIPRAEIFVFNTTLIRISRLLSRRSVHRTLERLAVTVPDWAGGTRLGECLWDFVNRYMPSVVDSRTVVVILSDGLDRGDTSILAGAMRRIQASVRSVIWLNPLLGDSRYEPTARGIAAALPFVDHLASAHNLESLERVVPFLAA